MDKKDKKDNDKKILDNLDFEPKKDTLKKKPSSSHNQGLEKKVKTLTDKNNDLLNDLKRAKADFINYQNRTLKQIKDAKNDAYKQFLFGFFSVLDDINAAEDAGELKGPVESIANKITSIFESNNIVKFGKVGDKFDPEIHEAVLVENKDSGQQKISKVLQYGYMLNGTVVRPARVAVS